MNNTHCLRVILASALAGILYIARASAQHGPAESARATVDVYSPYEPLIGDWDVSVPGKDPFMVMHFKWGGTHRGYIFYNASLLRDGAEETHFEGLLIWNALKKNLDMLLTLDPENGQTQESGSFYVTSDGTFVRQIFAVGPQSVRGPDGKPAAGSAMFRQTFKVTGPGEMKTVVLRDTLNGWVPTFPGSDNLVMKRKGATGLSAGHAEKPKATSH
jgi:hypothetical protein